MPSKHFFAGFRLLSKPGVRAYVIAPLLINVLLFIVLTTFAIQQFGQGMDWIMGFLPEWLAFLAWLIWAVFGLLLLLVYGYTFTILGNLVAAPFFGILSERVQQYLLSTPEPKTLAWRDYGPIIGHALGRELRKLGYFLPRLLGVFIVCAILSFIPLLNLITPVIGFYWGAWNLYLQYLDYPADNNKISFDALLVDSRSQRKSALSFGGLVLMGSSIPLLNLLVMPAAVAGATSLWVANQQANPPGAQPH
ncbi:MAG: sulfate transporter CysZ [Porticoccaceae bacterium]|nr:sulfate transporter CysZ [Porticoccaceae bacterium]